MLEVGDTIGEKGGMPCNVATLLGRLIPAGMVSIGTVSSPIDKLISDPKLEPRLSRLPAITLAFNSASCAIPSPPWSPFPLFVKLSTVGTLGLDDLVFRGFGRYGVGISAWELEVDGRSTKTDSV